MKAAQQPKLESPFCLLCNAPLDPDTPPGRRVCDGCMGNGVESQAPTQKCSKCRRVLPLTPEYWYRSTKKRTGYQSECKSCHNKVNNAARKTKRKSPPTTPDLPVKTYPLAGFLEEPNQQSTPDSLKISIDLSFYPELFAYLTDLATGQERSLEGQIRWILRQCYKFRTETPSAACGEG